MVDGDEHDALTRWKKYLHWRAGQRGRIKKKYNRRERKQTRQQLSQFESDAEHLDRL